MIAPSSSDLPAKHHGALSLLAAVLGLLLFFATTPEARAQRQLLDFRPGPRAQALGGSLVNEPLDATALFWNPAALAQLTETKLTLSTPGEFVVEYVGGSLFRPPRTGIGFGLGRAGAGNEASDFGSLGWARRLGQSLFLGTSVSLLTKGTESWPTAGLGVVWRPGSGAASAARSRKLSRALAGRYTFSLAAHNIPLVLSDIDHQVRIGAAFHPGGAIPALHLAHHFQRGAESTHLGVEWSPYGMLRLGTGVQYCEELSWGVGAAVRWRNLDVAIAYSTRAKRVFASFSVGIGEDAPTLAARSYEQATRALESGNLRQASRDLGNALAYGLSEPSAILLADSLHRLVQQQDHTIDSLLQVAQRLEDKGWLLNATVTYLKVLRLDPTHPVALRNVQAIKPRVNVYVDQLYASGVESFEKNDLDKARDIFQTILLVQEDHQGARSYLDRLQSLNRERAREHYLKGHALLSDGKIREAKQELEQALAYDPEHAGAQRLLQEVSAELGRQQRQVEALLADAIRAERYNEYLRAYTKYRQAQSLDPSNQSAASGVKRLAERVASHINARLAGGTAAYRRGDYAEARRLLSQVLQLDPQHQEASRLLQLSEQAINRLADESYARGMALFNAQDYAAALSEFGKVLSYRPDHAGALAMRRKVGDLLGVQKLIDQAQQAMARGNLPEALRLFTQVVETDPSHAAARRGVKECQERMASLAEEYFNRGMALYAEEDYRSAIELWNKVLEINPNHSGAREYKKKAQEQLRALETIPLPR
ncbi:MAG: tetratricopeptide repeat protein [candidate division KSB1 bacterium]|jgi:tetratricopeptide (TPR) repeat protein|nr:tetratricopeptide repeat protein [candidate division KSB1 bacterium]